MNIYIYIYMYMYFQIAGLLGGPLVCSLMARELRGSRYEGLHHGRTGGDAWPNGNQGTIGRY